MSEASFGFRQGCWFQQELTLRDGSDPALMEEKFMLSLGF